MRLSGAGQDTDSLRTPLAAVCPGGRLLPREWPHPIHQSHGGCRYGSQSRGQQRPLVGREAASQAGEESGRWPSCRFRRSGSRSKRGRPGVGAWSIPSFPLLPGLGSLPLQCGAGLLSLSNVPVVLCDPALCSLRLSHWPQMAPRWLWSGTEEARADSPGFVEVEQGLCPEEGLGWLVLEGYLRGLRKLRGATAGW